MDPPVQPLGETSIAAAQPEHDLSAVLAHPTHQEPSVPPTVTRLPPHSTGWSHDQNISVDESEDDDSAIGGFSEMTSTASARSSVFEFVREEDGRTYHRYRQGKYMLPNDEEEQDRLNMQHQLWYMTLDGHLSIAPLNREPEHVLDIGTGTGVWAIDYAIDHPTAHVIGSDLSPIQPNFVPVNCSFEVHDFEDEWAYEQKFDLIHGRLLLSCLAEPKKMFERAFASLSPGGYFEMQDCEFPAKSNDDSLPNSNLGKWYSHMVDACLKLGRDLRIVRNYKRWMEEVGFVNVEEKVFFWPVNTWPRDPHLKKLGFWYGQDLMELITGLKRPLMKGLGWTLEEVDAFHVLVKKDVMDRNVHAYHILRVVYGMKPEVTDNTLSA